jgi:epimerase transport system membrane fusion protein
MDIDRVTVGLQAEVRFSAFKQSKTPKMEGKVINISPDRFVDEKTGNPYYLARVELIPESKKKLGDLQLLPGMPAEVLIKTGERTLFQYLAQPVTNFFARSFIED